MNCPHCKKPSNVQDCVTRSGAPIGEGSIGVCMRPGCYGWWRMTDGEIVQYTPTSEEIERMQAQLRASISHFQDLTDKLSPKRGRKPS